MEVKFVGVAGLGLLGRGIAGCLLAHGVPVVAYDISPAERSAANVAITNAINELIDHGYCNPSAESTWRELYTEAKSIEELAHCHFLIESVVESAEAKAALFDQLAAILSPAAPIAATPPLFRSRSCKKTASILRAFSACTGQSPHTPRAS